MDFSNNGLWIAVVIVTAILAFVMHRRHTHKRKAAQYKADESLIQHLVDDLDYDDKNIYKDLPNRDCRVSWLKKHYPNFIEAAERHYKEENLLGAIAVHIDFKLLKNVYAYTTRERALSSYQGASYRKSLNEYQEKLNIFHAEQTVLEAAEQAAQEKAWQAEVKRRTKQEAEEKLQKNAAKTYWHSLSTAEQEAFKKAEGKTARKNSLPSTANTGYSVDFLYPLIMATQFSGINGNTDSTIEYCESLSHSSYDGGGSTGHHSSSSDSGYSSHDSGSYSSSDGGGDGGGGGGE